MKDQLKNQVHSQELPEAVYDRLLPLLAYTFQLSYFLQALYQVRSVYVPVFRLNDVHQKHHVLLQRKLQDIT